MDNRDNELAELQATIAQLRIDLSNQTELTKQADYHASIRGRRIADLQSEIERLKGGQGEPVAYAYKVYVHSTGIGMVWRDKVEREAPDTEAVEVKDLSPLYASQPAPVSAINENAAFEDWRKEQISSLVRMGYPDAAKAFRDLGSVQWAGWQARACLDKVKELNQ